MSSIAVLNQSTVLSDQEIIDSLPAFQHQANYQFAPFWRTANVRLHFVEDLATVPKGMWRIMFLDDSDQAGALGYHDLTDAGTPDALCFAGTDIQYGLSWSVTFDHEMLEILADPWINRADQVSTTQFFAEEVCDPVEADEDGYEISLRSGKSVLVSNFVLPKWFQPGAEAIRYDYCGLTNAPGELRPGGYQIIYDANKKDWTAIYNERGDFIDITHHLVTPTGEALRPRPSQLIRHLAASGKLEEA